MLVWRVYEAQVLRGVIQNTHVTLADLKFFDFFFSKSFLSHIPTLFVCG